MEIIRPDEPRNVMIETEAYVVVGDLMTDVVATLAVPLRPDTDTPATIVTAAGGSAANTAHWLAATGHRVVLLGRVGDDPFGDAAVRALSGAGVKVRVGRDPDAPTGTCLVLVDPGGGRTMVPDAGANARLSPADLADPLLDRADTHLHVSAYPLLRPATHAVVQAAIARVHAAGGTVSIDVASAGPIRDAGPATVLDRLAAADLILANGDELAALGVATPAALAARTGTTVVVKCGADGAAAATADGHAAQVDAIPAAVVDTTGAGDAFAAGFLPAWRAGAGLDAALAGGASLAARAVTRVGARP